MRALISIATAAYFLVEAFVKKKKELGDKIQERNTQTEIFG